MGKRGEGWFLVQVVLLGLILVAPRIASFPFPPWLRVLGGALLIAGAVTFTAGLLALGSNASPFPRPIEKGQLVTTGIYGVVRHPLYAGLILGSVGWALLLGSLLGVTLAAALFAFFDLKSRREEAWLIESYPGYPAYRKRVRKLIPWVY